MHTILYSTISFLFDIIIIAILVRAFLSWLPGRNYNRLTELLYRVTEPILAPIRSLIERSSFGRNLMFDFSPIIAILLIGLVRNIVLNLIR